ncbi:MAG: type IV pilus assembly protein PilM [Pirellulales bacterium]
MAKSDSFWGIDIGNTALKAVRCRLGDDPTKIVAEAFDFIEYPKILSQPDADQVELVRDALAEFLRRNPIKGSRVAISVPGQRGLPRFVKLPPVESSKIPDLVKFEAKQQIPFPLEDVVWDFQQMPGGTEEDGFSMETEVGLFAMKRDEVFKSLRPFINADIEVDIVQLTPIALFNYVVFDQMQDLPPPDQFNPEDPPESLVVLSLGTDTSDLVVTNGYRVWQRSIPLGGNHFTKAITKELKVTFAKAEHLKRNAMKTEDPRAIFQAMKPVFNDLVTEVQRSLNFFNSINKTAKLGRIVALGNTMKLRGLQKYLQQNLGMKVETVESFRGMSGPGVVNSPQFEENVGSFGVAYGLCAQALDKGVLGTNLLPGEILRERLIRAKKPWALASAAALLVGCGVGFIGNSLAWKTTKITPEFKTAFASVTEVKSKSSGLIDTFTKEEAEFDKLTKIGKDVSGITQRQFLWADVLRAINECLPQYGKTFEQLTLDAKGNTIPLEKREQINIQAIDCEWYPALEKWFTPRIQTDYINDHPELQEKPAAAPAPGPDGATAEAATPNAAAAAIGPTGPGFVIEVRGYHLHNNMDELNANRGIQYVKTKFLRELQNRDIEIRRIDNGKLEVVKIKDIGVEYPVVVTFTKEAEELIPNPYAPTDCARPAAQPDAHYWPEREARSAPQGPEVDVRRAVRLETDDRRPTGRKTRRKTQGRREGETRQAKRGGGRRDVIAA